MIGMIKKYTDCNIIVGQNGWIWLNGEPENETVAFKAIKYVEENSHKSGLTEQVEEFLKKETKKDLGIAKQFKENHEEKEQEEKEQEER